MPIRVVFGSDLSTKDVTDLPADPWSEIQRRSAMIMGGLCDAANTALAAHLEELGVTDADIDAALENAPITKMDRAYKAAKPKGKAK